MCEIHLNFVIKKHSTVTRVPFAPTAIDCASFVFSTTAGAQRYRVSQTKLGQFRKYVYNMYIPLPAVAANGTHFIAYKNINRNRTLYEFSSF